MNATAPTQAVAPKAKKRDIRELLQSDNVRQQIALALPKHLTPDRMTRVALTTINRTPKLLQCTPESLLSGLMLCSQVGLEPDGRNAHLIPYGDQCQVIFDWKGLVALARRNGVKNIAADVVCDNDEFEWYRTGDGLQFKHKVDWKKPRGAVYAAYCIWKDGDQFDGDVMTKDEVEGIRSRSRAGQNGPWKTDWSEMAKKTVVRRSSKKWPLDPEAATAFNADDDTILEDRTQTRPKFEKPVKLFEAQSVDLPAESEDDGLGPQRTEPVEVPAEEKPHQNYVKAVRGLLQLRGYTEDQLMGWILAKGKTNDTLRNLDDAWQVSPEVVKWCHDSFAELDKELAKVGK